MIDDSTEFVARISHGKDSLKMLQVIKSRGLPLDRITTTDVWATDTISARLPPMEEFVARMDQRIWELYHIQVEHLCARNPDGSKRTYEQMFYHIPNRKNRGGYCQGTILGFPDLWNPWCQAGLKRNAHAPSSRDDYRLPSQHPVQLVPEAQNLRGGVQGIPSVNRSYLVPAAQGQSKGTKAFRLRSPPGAGNSRSTTSRLLFSRARDRNAQRQKYCGVHRNRRRRACQVWTAQRPEACAAGGVRY